MDKKFGAPWHVVVGRAFSYEITYEVGSSQVDSPTVSKKCPLKFAASHSKLHASNHSGRVAVCVCGAAVALSGLKIELAVVSQPTETPIHGAGSKYLSGSVATHQALWPRYLCFA